MSTRTAAVWKEMEQLEKTVANSSGSWRTEHF
jgi:hypothetical protein